MQWRNGHDRPRWVFPALVLVTAVGLAIRLRAALGAVPWEDEIQLALVARLPDWHDVIAFLAGHESHPPLYYAFIRIWTAAFGSSDASVLAPSILLGTALVPASYLAGSRLFSREAGLAAAALAAFSPTMLDSALLARPYALLALLALLSAFLLVQALTSGRALAWVGYAVATAAMVWTHNWSWLVVGGEAVAVLAGRYLLRLPLARGAMRAWLLTQLAIVATFAVWVPVLLHQAAHAGQFQPAYRAPLASAIALILVGRVLIGPGLVEGLGRVTAILLPVLVASAGLGIVALTALRDAAPARRSRWGLWVLIAVPAAASGAAAILSSFSFLLLERCFAVLVPLLLVALAAGFARAGRAGTAAAVAIVSVWAVAAVPPARPNSDAPEFTRALRAQLRPSDLLVVYPEPAALALDHVGFPRGNRVVIPTPYRGGPVDWGDFVERWSRFRAQELDGTIASARSTGRRVWLITTENYTHVLGPSQTKTGSVRVLASEIQRLRHSLAGAFGAPVPLRAEPAGKYDHFVAELYGR